MSNDRNLVAAGQGERVALRNAVSLWADVTTDAASVRRPDLLRDKSKAVIAFLVSWESILRPSYLQT